MKAEKQLQQHNASSAMNNEQNECSMNIKTNRIDASPRHSAAVTVVVAIAIATALLTFARSRKVKSTEAHVVLLSLPSCRDYCSMLFCRCLDVSERCFLLRKM